MTRSAGTAAAASQRALAGGGERIAVLLPCAEQKPEYLAEAVASVMAQTSPRWELLVGLDPQPPQWIVDFFARFAHDARVRLVHAPRPGFAAALNAMLAAATAPFAGILLSDDRWMPAAVATLLRHRALHPEADFFHSSRRYIDARGNVRSATMRSRTSFTLDEFKRGSPVKHLLCWRRELALAIGGMNEALSRHGCDDYDFPWRMAEAGAVFRAIDDCLYEYRNHDEAPRLTTTTPMQAQIATIERMFRDHGASEAETCAFLDEAAASYLPRAFLGRPSNDPSPSPPLVRFREASEDARGDFEAKGFRPRNFFPHRAYVVPRCGADGMQLAQEMCGVNDPGALREISLYATDTAPLPPALFFDDEVVWHRRHMGLPGLVANANLAVDGKRLYVTQAFSDLVQRISRRREHKTRVENRFAGWAHLLINAIAAYARDAGLDEVYFPSAELAIAHTDPARAVQPELFERVYDRTVHKRLDVSREGRWWRAGVRENDARIAPLRRALELLAADHKTICIVHDVERGIGHRGIEDDFADGADRTSPQALRDMLAVEAARGVRVTYSVVGMLIPELRASIEHGGHALAFHSYAHVVMPPPAPPPPPSPRQRLRAGMRPSALLGRLRHAATELPGMYALERATHASIAAARRLGGSALALAPAATARRLRDGWTEAAAATRRLRSAATRPLLRAPAAASDAASSEAGDAVRDARAGADFHELFRCRQVDYRLRGYRPPQSRVTPGLHDRHLTFFNFEWLASSSHSLHVDEPIARNGIVKIPIHLDDFDLHRGTLTYEQWERRVLALVSTRRFVAIGLHDCYAEHWLAHYPRLLEKLAARGRLQTFEEVADFTMLAATRWR